MGSMHVDGVKVDQINSVVMGGVERVEDNTVMIDKCMHGSIIFNE